MTAFFDAGNLVGHIAYVLLIISMMMRSMHWLRLFAIGAGSVSAVYYVMIGDPVSFFWESLFTLVNAIQLLILFVENRRGKFSEDEQAFIDKVLKDIDRVHIRKLMRLGAWTEVQPNFVLIREDTEPASLIYIVKGLARVERKGKLVGFARDEDFLGEMSYLSGMTASATVTSESPIRFLAFDRTALRKHLARNPETRHALEAAFNRNLVDKLIKTSKDLHEAGVLPSRDPPKGKSEESDGAKAKIARIPDESAAGG